MSARTMQDAGGQYLSFSAAFTIHSLTGLVGNAAGGQAVDANLRTRHCGGQWVRDVGRHGGARGVALLARRIVWRRGSRKGVD